MITVRVGSVWFKAVPKVSRFVERGNGDREGGGGVEISTR